MTNGVLVIGYGSALRTDDGVGRRAAERLADDPRLDGATVIGCHQLTPELALDVSRAGLAVFIDAGHGPPAGTFTMEWMQQATASSGTGWSHILSPSSLVDLARDMYGKAPEVVVIKVGVESLMIGDRLSPVVEASLPGLIDAVAELIADHGARHAPVPLADHRHA